MVFGHQNGRANTVNLFSHRKGIKPIKSEIQSDSMVESLCKIISGKRKATLGDALKEIDRNTNTSFSVMLGQACPYINEKVVYLK